MQDNKYRHTKEAQQATSSFYDIHYAASTCIGYKIETAVNHTAESKDTCTVI